jgi:hypothetical protein
MSFFVSMPAQLSEWGWLFGFALVSLALVAPAVLADALYEGYRERIRKSGHRAVQAERVEQRAPSRVEESSAARRKAA